MEHGNVIDCARARTGGTAFREHSALPTVAEHGPLQRERAESPRGSQAVKRRPRGAQGRPQKRGRGAQSM